VISVSPFALLFPYSIKLCSHNTSVMQILPADLGWFSCVWPQTTARDLLRQRCLWEGIRACGILRHLGPWEEQNIALDSRISDLMLHFQNYGHNVVLKWHFFGKPILIWPTENNIACNTSIQFAS